MECALRYIPAQIILTESERSELERWIRRPTEQQRFVERARVVLLAAEGLSNAEISRHSGIPELRVGRWRRRFAESRMDGLKDKKHTGRPPVYGHDDQLRIVTAAVHPPEGRTNWTVRALTAHLKDSVGIGRSQLHNILRDFDLKPHREQQWLNSTDPNFEAKQADVVGLYLNPPENALVISVDEKTQMVVREPSKATKPMRPGTPARREFEYVRHGVQSLYAAFMVHEGTVLGRIEPTHSRVEFIRFLNVIDQETPPERELHLVLDNLSVHKTLEVAAWLEQHGRFHLHFTPTHASWLNQVEIWFSILSRQILKRGEFSSKDDQAHKIRAFIDQYNQTAKPFAWTSRGKVLAA